MGCEVVPEVKRISAAHPHLMGVMIKRNGMFGFFNLKNQQPPFSVGRPFSVIKTVALKESAYRATSVGKLREIITLLLHKVCLAMVNDPSTLFIHKGALMGTIIGANFCQSKPAKKKIWQLSRCKATWSPFYTTGNEKICGSVDLFI